MTAPALVRSITPTSQPAIATIAQRAMTVSLRLSAWLGQRLDRQVTADVLKERNATPDAGKFEKYLVPKTSLDPVFKAHTRARARHYSLTLPWGDDSSRILNAAAFFDYTQAMQEERTNCEAAYAAFCAGYPQLVADAPRRLGPALFRAADFPLVSRIQERFGFHLVVLPIPQSSDFRVALGADVEARIRTQIETTITERYSEAQRDLWTRLFDTLKHFTTTMRNDKQVFRNTTVTKLADLARLAPKLSLTPDPVLAECCEQLVQLLEGVAPDELRSNTLLRQHTATQAERALADIERAMQGAF